MKWMNIITLIILTILIVVLIVFISAVFSKGAKCVVNPISYAVKQISTPENEFSCFCSYANYSYYSINTNSSGSFYVNPSVRSLEIIVP